MKKRVKDYAKRLPVNELYTAVQGEGSRAGMPTIVIRTTGCTHRCMFNNGGWCDTWYSSIAPEKGKYCMNDIEEFLKMNSHITEIMLTGGSPTMLPHVVNEVTILANKYNKFVTIETEGSHFVETDYPIGLVSLSPKFSNSVPVKGVRFPDNFNMNQEYVDQKFIDRHNKYRLNKDAIGKMIEYHNDYHFKPVINPRTDPGVWEEIEAFRIEMNIPKHKTYIMPPGDSPELLFVNYPDVMNFCRDNGFNFTGRPHIIAFGTQRCV